MTKRPIKDVAASVRQRLYDKAKATGRPFQEVLQYFAMERFLYRLAQSRHADTFVLKGALMFMAWRAPTTRPTKDIDLLGRMENSVEAVTGVVGEVCQQEVEPDGVVFDASTARGRVIKEDADYEGVRVSFLGKLQNARITMQIDVGFGDVIVPGAALTEYPTILELPPPKLHGYTRETTVAEKFEAMVKLGQLNSRIRDFFDIWLLSRQFDFDGPTLAKAIQTTFSRRGTPLSEKPGASIITFASDPTKQTQWRGFLRKSRLEFAPPDLAQVVQAIAEFLGPVADAVHGRTSFVASWSAPGPWQTKQ